jgi:isopentenyldiphosphate isomerase
MNYYTQELLIPRVNEKDEITGTVERWDAHTNGILHRGFTVGVYDQDGNMILQHRKHPVFDNFYDLTGSSHQVYEGDILQDANTAIHRMLEREWQITQDMLASEPKLIGKTLYKSTHEKYVEHELCHLYTLSLKTVVPDPSDQYAYGYTVKPIHEITSASYPKSNGLAPWVISFFDDHLL